MAVMPAVSFACKMLCNLSTTAPVMVSLYGYSISAGNVHGQVVQRLNTEEKAKLCAQG